MRVFVGVAIIAAIIQASATTATAQVPRNMNVQGRLTDSTGAPLPAGTKTFTFKIFDTENSGTEIWPGGSGETQSVVTDDAGLWNANVGVLLGLTDAVFADTSRWLQVIVDDGINKPVVLPRVKLNTGPFAYRAAWSRNAVAADSADAITDGGVDFADIGQNGAALGQIMKWNGSAWVAAPDSTAAGGSGGGWTDDGTVVRLDTALDSVGIGTSTPSEKLEVNGNVLVDGKATIGFGHTNTGLGGFVAGAANSVTGKNATITGGDGNSADANVSTIGGGHNNSVVALGATVAGGQNNTGSGVNATIAGGQSNTSGGASAAVTGGAGNVASGDSSFVGGGSRNAASGVNATVSGGYADTASSDYTTVGGGRHGVASNYAATVGGGFGNRAGANYSTVGGGNSNDAAAPSATIGGGNDNATTGAFSTVSGGNTNNAVGSYSVVGGGGHNTASGHYALIGGGTDNTASGDSSIVGGGAGNAATGVNSTVGGGRNNRADTSSTVAGGLSNMASGLQSTVGGGSFNLASGEQSTVGGGVIDTASGRRSTISGGIDNNAEGYGSTVGGGELNTAGGDMSSVGGGKLNTASGSYATVPGGYLNNATGFGSFAAGYKANAAHTGSFVWADSSGAGLSSTKDNQFTIQAKGGVNLVTDADSSVAIEVGERFRDNAIIAWGAVAETGVLGSNFGVASVTHTGTGAYTVTIEATPSKVKVPIVQPHVSDSTLIRFVVTKLWVGQDFEVFIYDKLFQPVDCAFHFIVTGR